MIKFEYDDESEKILRAGILRKIFDKLKKQEGMIKENISKRLALIFKDTKEYTSLTSGELMAHFGLPIEKATDMVDLVIETFTKEIKLEFIGEECNIYAIRSNFEQILSLDVASYTSKSKKGSFEIPWLEWFLVQGDRILIENFHILPGTFSRQRSRSTRAIMVKSGTWGFQDWKKAVPRSYSGVITDNWITHTIFSLLGHLKNVFTEIIQKALNV